MVFRILDLFLYEGFTVIFSIALALLKSSRRDLLALDFEGVLKYFRVNLPKKYRSEANFKDLMQIWTSLHPKITEKKLKKYEKIYQTRKEEELLKQDPLVRYEKECRQLTNTVRRLEQENDDLANEYIDAKISMSKQLEDTKDDYEFVKTELIKYKTDFQNKLNESNDTNKRLMNELEQIKKLWRKESEKYQAELERNNIIINEYKQICNTLSNKVEKWNSFKKKHDAKLKRMNLCETCLKNNQPIDINASESGEQQKQPVNTNTDAAENSPDKENDKENSTITDTSERNVSRQRSSSLTSSDDDDGSFVDLNIDDSGSVGRLDLNSDSYATTNGVRSRMVNLEQLTREQEQMNKIKSLELELARVKLELVDAQCKNQEYDHKLKNALHGQSNVADYSLSSSSSASSSTKRSPLESTSTLSQDSITNENQPATSLSQTSLNNSSNNTITAAKSNNQPSSANNSPLNSLNNNTNSNNWLSKTISQFNQVVQKAQKNSNFIK